MSILLLLNHHCLAYITGMLMSYSLKYVYLTDEGSRHSMLIIIGSFCSAPLILPSPFPGQPLFNTTTALQDSASKELGEGLVVSGVQPTANIRHLLMYYWVASCIRFRSLAGYQSS